MRYLYDLYGAELEERINPETTILEYIASVLGLEEEIREISVAEKQIKEENCNLRSRFYSYSYSLNFWDYGSVFLPWYNSWKRFQQDVGLYLKLDFFREYGFIKLDLSRFYDSIYLHAVYKQMEEVLGADTMEDTSVKNILRYLGEYTEKLMYQIHGSIRGVPQGPAYARVLAEIFLSTVLEEFRRIYGYLGENCRFIRYVDDIYIIFNELDGQELLNHFSEYIQERGLRINTKKTRDIIITGSACVGYSLNPRKNFRKFRETSDIDVGIISNYYFDIAWHELRNQKYYKLDNNMKNALEEHKNRLIYWGTIATDKILPLLSFGTTHPG